MSSQILPLRPGPVVSCRYSFEENVRSAEELRYTLGKTIGSGAYAKVKAAWSPYEQKMVSPSPLRNFVPQCAVSLYFLRLFSDCH